MSAQEPLCVVYQDQPAGCRDPGRRPPAAPVTPTNIAGLSAIEYRIGTFTSFRRAMLDEVAHGDLLYGLLSNQPNPFAMWREGTSGDYQTTFIELWAYL